MRRMLHTYAVVWREGEAGTLAGKLALGRRRLALSGLSDGGSLLVPYDEIEEVRIVRAPRERLGGRPTVSVLRRGLPPVHIAGTAGVGVPAEIADRLATLMLGA